MVAAAEARPEQAGAGEPAVRRAGLGEDAAERTPRSAHDAPPAGWAALSATTASKCGSRMGSWAATTTVRPASQGSMAGASRATVGGSSEAVGSSSSSTGAGRSSARAKATRWRSPGAERQPVVADGRLQSGGQARHELGQPDGVEHGAQLVVARPRARRGAGSPPASC